MDVKRAEMSYALYEDVIRTESERAEITVDIYESADCVRDHDFRTETNTQQPQQQTGSDSVKIRSSRAAAVCLVLLSVLLLTAVTALCVHIYTNNTNYTQERDQLLTKINILTEERNQLLTKINSLTEERGQMLTNTTNLSDEREWLQTNNSNHIQLNKQLNQEKNEPFECFNGMDGWLYYKCSFYYISSETKSWTESRRHCTERGADLVIINNTEKQKTVDKMQDGKTGFWIGLTDSEEEGNWKWVDGSALNSGLWGSGQPNGRTSENCAVSYSSGFHDYPCNTNFKWICEKNILERTLKDQDFFII
ncbi:C-type lectin domain family 4 member M-like isoform X1 [Carassius gibelio]|uniref:C-type lectin domain family 4 member M-like isoform X1 n=1 Tax=Carassius gibelio TaxID=101364 RepID=UPI002278BC2C|nr:C-type lectin domain family 4 member M-like isoform X1 [Carassius gibelio]